MDGMEKKNIHSGIEGSYFVVTRHGGSKEAASMCEVQIVNKNIQKHWTVGGMGGCWWFLNVFRDAVDVLSVLWMFCCKLSVFWVLFVVLCDICATRL